MRPTTSRFLAAVSIVATLGLAACGGGDDDDDGGAGGAVGIGAAGGTVTAASGASVTVPAGALTQTTPIAIEASSAGAPALPADTITVGAMHALTPHGTSFATPATTTLPFDAAQVPAGATVQLLKTNAAQDGWEVVAGATVDASTISASLASFSWLVPFAAAAPAVDITGTWNSLFICDVTGGGSFNGDETIVITQSGSSVSFTASDESSGTGTITGDTVNWSSSGPGYTEIGTWTILDADSMVKTSTYTNDPSIGGGGTCSGSIHKQ